MADRTFRECGVDISHRHHAAIYCEACRPGRVRGERHHCDTPGTCYCQRETLVAMADLSNTEIGARFGVHQGTVYEWRRYYGLSAPPQRFARKYGTDQDLFVHIDTPEKAYILGFIVADGCVHKSLRTVMIGLRETDAEILNQIAQAMRCEAPLRYFTRNGTYPTRYGLVRLELHGTELVRHLSALGVSPNPVFSLGSEGWAVCLT